MLGVAAEAVRPLAARMAETGRGLGLSFRPGCGFSLPRDDLERHVEAVLLVACKPDGAGAAAAQGPERPVSAEDELALEEGLGGVGHGLSPLAKRFPSPARPRYGLE
jgi:hypothetical protein